MAIHVNWDLVSQAKLEEDLGVARALEMQCVCLQAYGYALTLINIAPNMGKISGQIKIVNYGRYFI